MWTEARTRGNGEGRMAFEMTMGLLVEDQEKYAQYRTEIAPLLEEHGARFRYDFDVARVLKGEAKHGINRLFMIEFPDRSTKTKFFVDARYLEIRARLFEKSVAGWTTIAEYERG